MFGLKSVRATGKLNVLSLPVCLCRAPKILAPVEPLSCALLTYNRLVARYEPGKKLSVSVCHNSKNDWLIMKAGYRTYPACFGYLSPHAIL